MRRYLLFFGLLVSSALPLLALAQNRVPDCVTVSAHARWGASAYNHVVGVANACERPVRCRVATDVSPGETNITVPVGETREVVTFLGSPAREFTPRVTCELVQ